MLKPSRCFPLLLLLAGLLLSCEDEDPPPTDDDDATEAEACVSEGQMRCEGLEHQVCVEGSWETDLVCAAPTPQCNTSLGCIACGANLSYCVENNVYTCNPEGSDWALTEECGDRECRWGSCYDPCELAAQENSYLGCDFLAVSTANSLLAEAFVNDFGVAVGNPSETLAAEVTVSIGSTIVHEELVQPGSTQAITLPYNSMLKASVGSVVAPAAAYEVHSNIPVVAYQYNPLHFQSGIDFSYTNDASLLIPEAALGSYYLVSSWPSFGIYIDDPKTGAPTWAWAPGFVAVAATADGTSVLVESTASTLGGDVEALPPGGWTTVQLNRGDVLQIFSERPDPSSQCDVDGALLGNAETFGVPYPVCLHVEDGDLTGTRISANQPVAVFSGHDCTFAPFERWACDHLEESMLPLEIWGAEAVVSAPFRPGTNGLAPSIVRVLALLDGTELTFDPPIHEPIEAGPSRAVELYVNEDVVITGTGPILVTQVLLGEQELQTESGDPAMGTMPPTDHWRSSYELLVPDTYEDDAMNIVSRVGAEILLDGSLITFWEPISESGYQVHRARLEPGSHRVHSETGADFGIVAYGYASYTSYLYPGGLDLTHNPLP